MSEHMSDDSAMEAMAEEVSEQGPSGSSQLQRSPISQGGSPASKKVRTSPNPAPLAREAIKWIRHTLEEQATKRTSMTVELQRNTFDMLVKLDTAVHDLVINNLQLKGQLEEAKRSAEICVGAAAAQFGTELRLREAAHEQTLEAVITRYAEKEAIGAQEAAAAMVNQVVVNQAVGNNEEAPMVTNAGPTYATMTRRKEARTVDRKADRSKSRATKRNQKIKEGRQEEHRPSFVLNDRPGKTVKEVRELIWNQVVAKNGRPKCQMVTTKAGKVILKPSDKETSDVLRHLTRVSTLLKEDSLRWPRVIIRGVSTDMDMGKDVQRSILAQNPELGIPEDVGEDVIRPLFKSGPRDRATTNWVVEVNPAYHVKFENTMLYLGFMRCRAGAYEEVTQCHLCLRHGHPAAKCFEKECVCAHCARKGHKAADCPAAEADPICVNCKGKHNARDKTCASRTAYVLSQVRRTHYGTVQ